MRKPIPKSVRKLVYAKYDGHCAYCGCKIPETAPEDTGQAGKGCMHI